MKPVNPLVFLFVFQGTRFKWVDISSSYHGFISFKLILALWESTLPLPSHQAEKSQNKQFYDVQVRGDRDTIVEENPLFNCSGFGVFPHPTRCEWYYTCYFGDSVKLWACSLDGLFDVNNEGCNLPQDTDCGDRERPEVEGTVHRIGWAHRSLTSPDISIKT